MRGITETKKRELHTKEHIIKRTERQSEKNSMKNSLQEKMTKKERLKTKDTTKQTEKGCLNCKRYGTIRIKLKLQRHNMSGMLIIRIKF